MAKCLLPSDIEKIKEDFKKKNETFRPSDYIKLDGDQITKKLEPIVGDNAKQLSQLIQEKLILKNRIQGLEILRDKLNEKGRYSPSKIAKAKEEIARYKQKNLERIMSPKEHQSFLSSLAAQLTGTELDRTQAKTIFDKSTEIQNLKETAKKDTLGTNAELETKQQQLHDYINSLNEKPAWKSIRDSLASLYKNLFIGIKTGVKTATLGTLNSIIEVINRRASSGVVVGDVDIAKKLKLISENIKLGAKTGANAALKTSLEDNSIFGSTRKGYNEKFGGKDTIKEGNKLATGTAKVLNVAARGLKYFTINILHKAPMLINSSVNFADALDITASQIAKMDYAKGKGMDANAIFEDASKVEPETDLGKIARNRAQQDAMRVLNINNTPLSDATLGLQKIMNKNVPTLGDYVIPMAKVPSSVIYNELENFGVGFGTGTYDVAKGIADFNNLKELGKESTPEAVSAILQARDGIKTLTRTIGVIGVAALITANLTKKDFYTDNYGNSYVKMGEYWLNTEAFGGAGTAVSGMMMGKTGHTGFVFDYGKGGFTSFGKAPLVDSLNSVVQKGKQGSLASGITSSFLNPILAQDIQKSVKEKSLNPVLVGTLVRTEEQKKQEDSANKLKSAASKKAKVKLKTKGQTIF